MVYQFEMQYADDGYDVMEDFAEILGLIDDEEYAEREFTTF